VFDLGRFWPMAALVQYRLPTLRALSRLPGKRHRR